MGVLYVKNICGLYVSREKFIMEAMLNSQSIDVNMSTSGVWNKICLAFPVLASKVSTTYMLTE